MLVPVDNIIEVKCPQSHNYWIPVSIWGCYAVVDSSDKGGKIDFPSFESLYDACKAHNMRGVTPTKTLFQKPAVRVKDASSLSARDIILTARNFKGFSFRVRNEIHEEWSIKRLMEELSASDFMALAQDRGWNIQF